MDTSNFLFLIPFKMLLPILASEMHISKWKKYFKMSYQISPVLNEI